jgi:hypothetical protein
MQYRPSFSLRNAAAKTANSHYWKSSLPARCAASRYCQQMFGLRPANGKNRTWRRSFSLQCRDWNYQEGR